MSLEARGVDMEDVVIDERERECTDAAHVVDHFSNG